MSYPLVPVDNRGMDWPRKIATAVNRLLQRDRADEVAALQTQVADLEARVTALETP